MMFKKHIKAGGLFLSSVLNKINWSFVEKIVMVLNIIIAVWALRVSIKAYNSSNYQFKTNSIASDSLFNLQLQNERLLNEKITNQLIKINALTDTQIQITNKQTNIISQQLTDQINSGNPILLFGGFEITDTNCYVDKMYSPKIHVSLQNVGKRIAEKVNFRCFCVYKFNGKIYVKNGPYKNLLAKIEPNGYYNYFFKPKMEISNKDPFFIAFDVNYHDSYSKLDFYQVFYNNYELDRSVYQFVTTDTDMAKLLQDHINSHIDLQRKNGDETIEHIRLD